MSVLDNTTLTTTTSIVAAGAVTTPSYTFTGDLNTGIYSSGADIIDISTGGTNRLSLSTTLMTSNLPITVSSGNITASSGNIAASNALYGGSGSVTIPSISFTGDTNIGIYSSAADIFDITTGGTNRLSISTTAITPTIPITEQLGSVGAPSYSFTGDTNTGIYSSAADTVDISTNGVNRLSISTAAITPTIPILEQLGSASAPSYSFTGDTNTGIYSSTADTVNISAGGSSIFSVTTTGIYASKSVIYSNTTYTFPNQTETTLVNNTQVTSDGFITGYVYINLTVSQGNNVNGEIRLYCDSSSTPTTRVTGSSVNSQSGVDYQTYGNSFCYPIKKNFYYKITGYSINAIGQNSNTSTVRVEFQPFNT